jgi:uncharacterized damage-inducible protein DinB
MYGSIQEFLQDWKNENEATLKIMNNLTDASLSQKVYAEGRTLGRLAWHITTSITEMLGRIGLSFKGLEENAPAPKSAKEIAAAYEKAASAVTEQVSKWDVKKLAEEDDMYGEMWSKNMTLHVLIRHQIHHRAQMTVLMRQAGLKVPGVYGPSKEEWAAMGIPAQA